jgi:hypothetical protein
LHVTNSTFYANSVTSGSGGAGGAGGPSGFGGDGGDGGNGGSATGAAIESTGGGVVVNCTFADNGLNPGTGGAGGALAGVGDDGQNGETGFSSGGAIYARGSATTIANNILANSIPTLGGSVTDRGGNLSTDRNSLLVHPASFQLVNPRLRTLATNGGPTLTLAIGTNSPAINAGIEEFCLAFDQRGSNRVGRCDIGAVEFMTALTNQPLPQIPTNVLNGLTVARSTNLVTLLWPGGYTNLFLQFATNLLDTNSTWAIPSQTPSNNNGSNVVTISTTNAAWPRTFFRLFGVTGTNSLPTPGTNSGPPGPQ